ncbi:DNA protecting protein DprA [Companilactobacillus mindensis DSM 14500]|uniref:DNA protecting protein DprA n=2 Tax=Companilactobacillus mindensis TaxID=167481 RepID=A0A0R1QN82_9LACO|nr:DNA protecting protein DprA [Companilactobacillus mindensis DSM 14500]
MIACLKIPQVGPISVRKLLEKLPVPQRALTDFNEIKRHAPRHFKWAMEKGILDRFIWQDHIKKAQEELLLAEKLQITVINFREITYPQKMLKLHNFPVILYAKGNVNLLNRAHSVAVVGNRMPTSQGIEHVSVATKYFVQRDFVIVSGLALGCDTKAHQTALENSGKTLAVLAAGLDQPIYPRKNVELAENIVANSGLLLSTRPLKDRLYPRFLAARDEWQSGLSEGVVAVEPESKSGTNITLNFAHKHNRPSVILDKSSSIQKQLLELESKINTPRTVI